MLGDMAYLTVPGMNTMQGSKITHIKQMIANQYLNVSFQKRPTLATKEKGNGSKMNVDQSD